MLILPRLTLLVIGLVLVYFLRGWGMSIYLVVFALTCRYLAGQQGVRIHDFPMRESEVADQNHGDKYAHGLLALFGLAITISFLISLKSYASINYPVVVGESFFLNMRPCADPSYSEDQGHNRCEVFLWGAGVMCVFAPIVTALYLPDLVNVSRVRVRVGWKRILYLMLFTVGAAYAAWGLDIGPISSDFNGYIFLWGSMFWQLLWVGCVCRLTV